MPLRASLIAISLCLVCGCSSSASEPEEDDVLDTSVVEIPAWDMTSLELYDSATNPFAQPIGDNPTLHPDSDVLVTSLQQQFDDQGMLIVVSEWSMPVYMADASTPRVEVLMMQDWAPYEAMVDVPFPAWTRPDPEEDGSAVILDLENRLEYDLWELQVGDPPTAGWGNVISMDSNGIFPTGLSARGSGFALLNGMIWPHELEAGRIEHALVFSYDLTKDGGPVAPATESDGTGTAANNLPEGARIQLDPTLDVRNMGFEPWLVTVAVALQEYGMILGDDGGGISLYAIGPRSFAEGEAVYDGLLPLNGSPYVLFPDNFPIDRFRVLDYGPQDPTATPNAHVQDPSHFR